MARWIVSVPQTLLDTLNQQRVDMTHAVSCGEVPPYPLFVKNLLKDGATPAEEFLHAAVGFAGEAAGEVLELAKKVQFYGKEINVEKLVEELGDARFYYQSILNTFGLTDEMVVAANVKKLRVRYASGKFSTEQALARADKNPQPEPRKFMTDIPNPVPARAGDGLVGAQPSFKDWLMGRDPDTVGESND